MSPEPCFPYLLGFDVVWPTAVVVGPASSAVVLGRHDAPTARDLGVHEVRAYDESIAGALRDVLDGMDAERVALNYDRDDVVADGLSHGLFLQLRDYLPDREFTSASDLIRRLRGEKSETEYERVRAAAAETEELLQTATATWTPETTEREFAEFLHERMAERGLDSAWAWDYCPTVHMGDREVGHTLPGEHTVDQGELLHVDFGIRRDGYASDIQRLWVRGEASAGLREAFRDVRAAIDAGHDALGPGAVGHEVDAAAREALTSREWPAFEHAFGHQVGRAAHDGGPCSGRSGSATGRRRATRCARGRCTRWSWASRPSGGTSDKKRWSASPRRARSGWCRRRRNCGRCDPRGRPRRRATPGAAR
ncbi:M24 family metallopeptidase [Halobaculum halobium]|uniref:M24 family metallopeptidase n=1 Tax=Halobaculum halobium TaxID=3032281 RepID=UPI0036091C1F